MTKQAIDFSCKHDILIRHKDGILTPMDEPYYEIEQIAPGTWRIMSSGDYHYLLEGDEEGISIDTGYGAGNLREYLETVVGKPVPYCINTHYHFDHSANNCYFDLVYMASEDVDKAAVPYPSFDGIEFPRDYEVGIVGDNSVVGPKGRELEIFKIGDHTPGGIAILDRKARILFIGDEIMPNGKNIGTSVETYKNNMEKLMAHRDEFDRVFGGSLESDAEVVDLCYEAAKRILAGERTPDAPERKMPPRHAEPEGGPKIYDCQYPHKEDAPGTRPGDDKGGPMQPKKRAIFIYEGRRFDFDEERIFD